MHINIHNGWFWLNLGWYPGEIFKVFSLNVGERLEDSGGATDMITIFGIQITRFCFAFGWERR